MTIGGFPRGQITYEYDVEWQIGSLLHFMEPTKQVGTKQTALLWAMYHGLFQYFLLRQSKGVRLGP